MTANKRPAAPRPHTSLLTPPPMVYTTPHRYAKEQQMQTRCIMHVGRPCLVAAVAAVTAAVRGRTVEPACVFARAPPCSPAHNRADACSPVLTGAHRCSPALTRTLTCTLTCADTCGPVLMRADVRRCRTSLGACTRTTPSRSTCWATSTRTAPPTPCSTSGPHTSSTHHSRSRPVCSRPKGMNTRSLPKAT